MASRFSPAAVGAFELLFRPWLRTRMRAVRLAGLPHMETSRPLLLAANHCSWWDGFMLREAQRVLRPEAPMYTLMTEAELKRFPFLRRLGVLGIDPASPPSIAYALRFLEDRLRERPDSVVVYFPQGRIWPSHRRPLNFQRGVELFVRRLPVTVFPVGLHLEPLNAVAPTFFLSMGGPVESGRAVDLERAVEAEVDAIHAFLALHGEDASRAWPAPHSSLPAVGERVPDAL